MAADNSWKQLLIGAIGIVVTIFLSVTGAVIANEKQRGDDNTKIRSEIKEGDETVRVEVKGDILRLENKIERMDDKIDRVVEMLGRAERRAR